MNFTFSGACFIANRVRKRWCVEILFFFILSQSCFVKELRKKTRSTCTYWCYNLNSAKKHEISRRTQFKRWQGHLLKTTSTKMNKAYFSQKDLSTFLSDRKSHLLRGNQTHPLVCRSEVIKDWGFICDVFSPESPPRKVLAKGDVRSIFIDDPLKQEKKWTRPVALTARTTKLNREKKFTMTQAF